ncbi:MAG: hypothetical protein Kow0062_11490 [Acidobacteriota bacterium]
MPVRTIVAILLLAASLALAGDVVDALDGREAGFRLRIDPLAGWTALAGLERTPHRPTVTWTPPPEGTRSVVVALEDADGAGGTPLWVACAPAGQARAGRALADLVPFRAPGWKALWHGRYVVSAWALERPPAPGEDVAELLARARREARARAVWQAGGGWLR